MYLCTCTYTSGVKKQKGKSLILTTFPSIKHPNPHYIHYINLHHTDSYSTTMYDPLQWSTVLNFDTAWCKWYECPKNTKPKAQVWWLCTASSMLDTKALHSGHLKRDFALQFTFSRLQLWYRNCKNTEIAKGRTKDTALSHLRRYRTFWRWLFSLGCTDAGSFLAKGEKMARRRERSTQGRAWELSPRLPWPSNYRREASSETSMGTLKGLCL